MIARGTMMQRFCIAVVLSITAQIDGQVVTVSPPSVAATTLDQNTIINCSVQNPGVNDIVWNYNPSWSQADVKIFSSYYNVTYDAGNFTVANYRYESQGNQYEAADLMIKAANGGLAATYTCSLVPATAQVAESSFIVLDPVKCPPPDETEYAVGTIVNITCSVNFYQRDKLGRAPTLEIYQVDPETILPGIPNKNDTTVSMTLNKTLTTEDDNAEFMCVVSFANNDPEYRDNCTITYFVLHEVTAIIFDPPSSVDNPTIVAVGSQINCTANGRPIPTITWYDDQGNMVDEGEQLTVIQEMQEWKQPVSLTCKANNSIDGGLTYASVEGNYTFLVGGAPVNMQSF